MVILLQTARLSSLDDVLSPFRPGALQDGSSQLVSVVRVDGKFVNEGTCGRGSKVALCRLLDAVDAIADLRDGPVRRTRHPSQHLFNPSEVDKTR